MASPARDEVVALLTAALPVGITVMPYSRSVDSISGDTVMVRIDEVTPSPIPNAQRQYTFALLLLVPQTTAGSADDELDAVLEDVLFALESSNIPNGVVWTKATRATFEDKFPAYQVDLVAHITKE